MLFFVFLMANYHSYFIFISTRKNWVNLLECTNETIYLFVPPLLRLFPSPLFWIDLSVLSIFCCCLNCFNLFALHENNVTEKDITLVKMHKSTSSHHATKRNVKRRTAPANRQPKTLRQSYFFHFAFRITMKPLCRRRNEMLLEMKIFAEHRPHYRWPGLAGIGGRLLRLPYSTTLSRPKTQRSSHPAPISFYHSQRVHDTNKF